jgi:membrane protein DedA with SNARE-associated domain
MSAGRLARYCILAYLGAAYGRKIFRVILAHGETLLIVMVALVVIAALVLLVFYFRRRRGTLAKAH